MATAASAKPRFRASRSMHMMFLLVKMETHLARQAGREQTRALKAVSPNLNDGWRKKFAKPARDQAAGLRATGFSDALRRSNNACGFGKLFAMSKSQSRNLFTLGMTRYGSGHTKK